MKKQQAKPMAYALLWHSKKTATSHSSQLVWADAAMLDDPGKTLFERYGAAGQPFTKGSDGQWFRVLPLWALP